MTVVPGSLIGNYRVLSLLGEGGMGIVYHAEHVVLGMQAAIKVLLPHVARQGDLVQRFINEGRVASQMNHRNVVKVLDAGTFQTPNAPEAQWYIALEYLHGKSLGRFIADYGGKPIDIATIVHVIGEAANGLHAAHTRHGLVHRDIKPDNLYVTQEDDDPLRIKILDFGIAKLRQEISGVQTQSQTAMGTPAYAAPEQLRESKNVDARADVWALGVVTHEMLTGVRPWGTTTSVWEIIAHHSALKTAPDPRAFRPDTPPKLAEVISRAMEPNPARRWKSTKVYACALAEAVTMPYSANGLAILDKFANELTRASNLSVTVGRQLPAEIHAAPPEIVTARERRVPAQQPESQDPLSGPPHFTADGAPAARPISTLAASSGQSYAPGSRTGRVRNVALAIAALAVVAGAVVAISLVVKRSDKNSDTETARSTAAVDATVARSDAATPPSIATPSTSALAIVTTPDGAEVFIDGVSRGRAPLNVEMPVGKKVELRADASGYSAATRSIAIETTPQTVRIDLAPLIDAGTTTSPVTPPHTSTTAKASSGKNTDKRGETQHGQKHGTSAGSAGASTGSDQGFSPNDVL